MATNSLRVSSLLNLKSLASAPLSPQAGDVYYDSSLGAFQLYNGAAWQTYLPSDGSVALTSDLDMSGFKVINMADPTLASDAATKAYVDQFSSGLSWKSPVRALASVNVALSGVSPLIVDSVSLISGDRVMLTAQTTPTPNVDNGIYLYTDTAGTYTLTRSTDTDTGAELLQAAAFVTQGTLWHDTAWVNTADAPITIGTTPLVFLLFSSTVGGANTSLSNLTSPTDVNQSLLPTGDGNVDLGGQDRNWAAAYINNIATSQLNSKAGNNSSLTIRGSLFGNILIAGGVFGGDGTGGAIQVNSGDITGTNGISGALTLKSGSSGAGSGIVTLQSGTTATSGPSGAVSVSSGNSVGLSGAISILSGNSSGGNSGNITIQTGTGTARGDILLNARSITYTANPGSMTFTTAGSFTFSGGPINSSYGAINLNAAGNNDIGAGFTSGATPGNTIRITAGAYNGSNTDIRGGELRLQSGTYSGQGSSYVSIYAGVKTFPSNGSLHAATPVAYFTNNSLSLGPAASSITNPSAVLELTGTLGALLLSRLSTAQEGLLTPSDGMMIYNTDLAEFRIFKAGSWASVTPGAAGANTTLSNLEAPTSINQDLLPSASNAVDLGSSVKMWGEGWIGKTYINTIGAAVSSADVVNIQPSAIIPVNNDSIELGSSSLHYLALHTRNGYFYNGTTQLLAQAIPGIVAPDGFNTLSWGLLGMAQGSSIGMITDNSAAADATATSSILIETGNKTAGTGHSGNIEINTGESPVQRGDIVLTSRNVYLQGQLAVVIPQSVLDMSTNRITNVGEPTDGGDAVPRGFLDANFVPVIPQTSIGITDASSTNIWDDQTSQSRIIFYQIKRASSTQTGQLFTSGDGASVADIADIASSTGDLGITFSVTSVAGTITLVATATATGASASMSYNIVMNAA